MTSVRIRDNEGDGSPLTLGDASLSETLSHQTSQSALSCSVYSKTEFINAPLHGGQGGQGFFRRIPCKARGVPGEHVAINAYVDIPINAKHGTVLSCSHPACRLSGRLFRFCSVCQVPVAKRNFARRHTHGLSLSEIASSNNEPIVPDAPPPVAGHVCSDQVFFPPPLGFTGESSLPAIVKSMDVMGRKKVPGEVSIDVKRDATPSLDTSLACRLNGEKLSSTRESDQTTTLQVTPDELDWLFLFRQRPGPKDSKEAWVSRVEEVAGFPFRSERRSKKGKTRCDEDMLPEIEAPADGLANFDVSNMEDLFE